MNKHIKKLRLNHGIKLNQVNNKKFVKELESGKYNDLLYNIKDHCEYIKVSPNQFFEFESLNNKFLELSIEHQVIILKIIDMFYADPLYKIRRETFRKKFDNRV